MIAVSILAIDWPARITAMYSRAGENCIVLIVRAPGAPTRPESCA
jgi:hypothetical protein